MFGVLNVNKPKGITSHDVVSVLRRITHIKQIGHTGTLDPFAQGVLPVCIGKSTRLIEYFADDKEYLATVQFGKSTTTFDLEGEAIFLSDKKIASQELELALLDFEGEIEQTPPIYSALKVNGKKLYEYAREGKSVEIASRKVFIEKIELKHFDETAQIAEILISCSKGTYIRSIANDLGEKLSCGGHLIKLVRTQAGNCLIENAIALEDFKTADDVQKNLINPLELINLPKTEISEEDLQKVSNGIAIKNQNFGHGETIILIYNKEIKAVGEVVGESIKLKKVFQDV